MSVSYRSVARVGQAAMALFQAEVALRTGSLERACRWLGVAPPDAPSGSIDARSHVNASAKRRIRANARAVERAARWLPVPNTCLRRALALGWLLRDLRPTLRIGVSKERGFEAHAWLEIERAAVGADGAAAGRFQVLRRPSTRLSDQ